MKDNSITQVDVRRMNRTDEKSINELAKYSAKDSDYGLNQKVFDVFYDALKGRQLLTYNALFKDANKLYKNKKLEKYKPKDETEYVWQILYRFYGVEYVEDRKKELSKEEYNKLTDYEAKRAEKIAFNKAKIKQQWAKFHRVMEKRWEQKKIKIKQEK